MTELTPIGALPPAGSAPARQRSSLSRRQKAAIIVKLLLNEGAEVPLAALPEEMQHDLTQQMGAMRYVDRATLAHVVREFADELDSIGLSFPGGIAGALDTLDGRISPRTAARLRKEAGVRQSGDPWDRLRALPVEELLTFAENESQEVAAVLLSKLDTAKAAELLGALPGDKARRITYAISLTGAVTPEAVDRIGLSLASQLDNRPLRAFKDDPSARIGDILNYSASQTRDELLSALDEADADIAGKVRRAIFTFGHIPERVAARDVPRAMREVDQADLVTALAAAEAAGLSEAAEFILGNLSRRLADGIREEIAEVGRIRPRDGEQAMNALVLAIRQLVDAGEITLLQPDDDVD